MKINFVAHKSRVPDEVLEKNRIANSGRGLPVIGQSAPRFGPLAVVGGGPSISDHIEDLKNWTGDIWAINGAMRWCVDNGIDAAFYTIDPSPTLAEVASLAKAAILGTVCDPEVVDAVEDVTLFPVGEIPSGTTSACTAPIIAAHLGHSGITLFGCESSFEDRMHVYDWPDKSSRLLVKCGEAEYLTTPQLIMQAEYLAEIIRSAGGYVRLACGGFLPALAEHGDYDVLKVSRDLAESLNGNNHIF